MKNKFKIGDKVIGNEKADYSITIKGWTGIVTDIRDSFAANIFVRKTMHSTGYWVTSDSFDLWKGGDIKMKFKKGDKLVLSDPRFAHNCGNMGGRITRMIAANQDYTIVIDSDEDSYSFHLEDAAGNVLNSCSSCYGDAHLKLKDTKLEKLLASLPIKWIVVYEINNVDPAIEFKRKEDMDAWLKYAQSERSIKWESIRVYPVNGEVLKAIVKTEYLLVPDVPEPAKKAK